LAGDEPHENEDEVVTMSDFATLANWKLLAGSHDSPDEGACVAETALIAGGFEYKAIKSPEDCPPCFSRVVAQYAIRLNDNMPDDLRRPNK
jgi:hypothetical protein